MRTLKWGDGTKWGDPNAKWGDPSYVLEPGDPGYVDPNPQPPSKPRKARNYMASNPTPDRYDELIAAGEDLADGLHQHEVAIQITQHYTEAIVRAALAALITAKKEFTKAEGLQGPAYTALRTADSNGKGFIAAAINSFKPTLGTDWTDKWVPTNLPDNTVGIPRTQDKRFAALGGLRDYLTDNPDMEVSTPKLTITAARAGLLYDAVSNARNGVTNALSNSAAKKAILDAALAAFRKLFRDTVDEIGKRIEPDDPRWYDFGLNRPADGDQPDIPFNVIVTPTGGGRLLIQIDGARRANSFNYYKKIVGTDAEPVKVTNTEGTQYTIENLPVGATVEVTVTGVNDAGEGNPSDPISVVVA